MFLLKFRFVCLFIFLDYYSIVLPKVKSVYEMFKISILLEKDCFKKCPYARALLLLYAAKI